MKLWGLLFAFGPIVVMLLYVFYLLGKQEIKADDEFRKKNAR